ncbi:RHPN2 [Branchiostoma lanceolatum]|uniref:RHPN2 protein n=2 Tax=Branchiostoma lanceolatum TaxID=7740 RepID=A0A8K0EY90_BRALA|nr:RHPN2 [Branchiostoma lanceolatum]
MTDVIVNGSIEEETGEKSPPNGHRPFRKGSNPLNQTQRGRLQHRRSVLNTQINKEMRMRAGAENLYRACNSRKMKETVALELSFVNSNLQLLKEELSDLNSSVEVYQSDSESRATPMIPLGLKETKDVDFHLPFKDFILEHYSEDSSEYDGELKELHDLRRAMRTPERDEAGIELLMEYYNQLYYVEKRFFPPNRHLGIYFHWFDSLTGVPSSQRTVAFEKGSVLFNIGALYTQIGAKQDRTKKDGINAAIDAFQKAAGAFKYLQDNFSHAPSMDMGLETLEALIKLMLAQVQECVFERKVLDGWEENLTNCLTVAQESAKVSEAYSMVHKAMNTPPVKDYVPFSWISMVLVKSEHFKAQSHYLAAVGFIDQKGDNDEDELEKLLSQVHLRDADSSSPLATDREDRKQLGKAHLREALILHEDALRVHRMCKKLRQIDTLGTILKEAHNKSMTKYSDVEEEDEFYDEVIAPRIQPKTHQRPEIKPPNFANVKVVDIFHRLGPLAVFSARNQWSVPRTCGMEKGEQGFGFVLRGDSPVIVAEVEPGSKAAQGGVKPGDFIVAVDGRNVKWGKHHEVINLILSCGEQVSMQVVTPQGRDYLHPQQSNDQNGRSSSLSQREMMRKESSPTTSETGSTNSKRFSWGFRRREKSHSQLSAQSRAQINSNRESCMW